jgi:hypothetical protein
MKNEAMKIIFNFATSSGTNIGGIYNENGFYFLLRSGRPCHNHVNDAAYC